MCDECGYEHDEPENSLMTISECNHSWFRCHLTDQIACEFCGEEND